jgi:hypothetical protein
LNHRIDALGLLRDECAWHFFHQFCYCEGHT